MSLLLHFIKILQKPELLLDVLSYVVVPLRLDDVQPVLGNDGQFGDHRLESLLSGVRDEVENLLGWRFQTLIMIVMMIVTVMMIVMMKMIVMMIMIVMMKIV